jgi:hypothetical protein
MRMFELAKRRIKNLANTNQYLQDEEDITFSDEQIRRLDEINNAADEFCRVILNDPNYDHDMSITGEIIDYTVELLNDLGYTIYYPAIVWSEDTGDSTICDYSFPPRDCEKI